MKKFTLTLFALICVFCCVVSLAACNNSTSPIVLGLLIAKTGEEAKPGVISVSDDATYGTAPDWSFYKLYLQYTNDEIKEIALDDEKLTIDYSYYEFNSKDSKKIEKLPEEYIAGSYTITYIYDGNSDYKATATVNVNLSNSGAFVVQPAKTTWYADEETPSVTLKNPKGLSVEQNSNTAIKTDDTDGAYTLRYVKKEAYDTLSDAQKSDYDYLINNRDVNAFIPGTMESTNLNGEYMLFATVDKTYNYDNVITPAVKFTVKNPIIERPFYLQEIVTVDSQNKVVDGDETDYVYMAENLTKANQGKTVICKPNGELRGTAILADEAFDDLKGEDVFKYSLGATSGSGETALQLSVGNVTVGTGVKSGNTFTLTMPMDEGYSWIITFTCE